MSMRRHLVSLPAFVALSLMAGCGSSGTTDDPRGNILLGDQHNYRTTASLSIPIVDTAPATDLDICWTNVITDLQCHAVAPLPDLDNVSLLRISHLSKEVVAAKLADGSLSQSMVAGYLDYHTDKSATCAKL